ncbi:MAG: hypothetical protein R2856_04390 [Caldilineaceae bacterium]
MPQRTVDTDAARHGRRSLRVGTGRIIAGFQHQRRRIQRRGGDPTHRCRRHQIEVEGFTDARYNLTIDVQSECSADAAPWPAPGHLSQDAALIPAIPVNFAEGRRSAVASEDMSYTLTFAPMVGSGTPATLPQMHEDLFLPMLSVR